MTTGARFAKWGLGLFAFGVFLNLGVIVAPRNIGQASVWFCDIGLLGVFAVGWGYFDFDAIWPSFLLFTDC
jgi:hypothetical protein